MLPVDFMCPPGLIFWENPSPPAADFYSEFPISLADCWVWASAGCFHIFLDRFPYYQAMPWIVGIAFAGINGFTIGHYALEGDTAPKHVTEADQKISSRKTILADGNFLRYLVWRGLMVMLDIATPFYTLSAIGSLKLADSQVGIFTIMLSLSETILNPLWGWLGDHKGFYNIVVISAIAGSMAAFLAATAPGLVVYYLIFMPGWSYDQRFADLQLQSCL